MYTYEQRIVSSMKRNVVRSLSSDSDQCTSAIASDDSDSGSEILRSPKFTRESRKRSHDEKGAIPPPLAISGPLNSEFEMRAEKPRSKRQRQLTSLAPTRPTVQAQSPLLSLIPQDVIHLILSFNTTASDRFALQLTCRNFQQISNTPEMICRLNLEGDPETGAGAILRAHESPEVSLNRLLKFAISGNLEALYMMGVIKSFCHEGSQVGISILNHACRLGCPRSSYLLGLILRDISKTKSKQYLENAAKQGYLPAWQELLSAMDFRKRYGDMEASVLKRYLDPSCLNRFLGNHYVDNSQVRKLQTSHCWNPLCGRWAFRASANTSKESSSLCHKKTKEQLQSLLHSEPYVKSHLESLLQQQQINGKTSDSIDKIQTRECFKDHKSADGICSKNDSCRPITKSNNFDKCDVQSICSEMQFRVSRMKMCSSCRRAKYCSKLCQVYDWRSGRHKMECHHL